MSQYILEVKSISKFSSYSLWLDQFASVKSTQTPLSCAKYISSRKQTFFSGVFSPRSGICFGVMSPCFSAFLLFFFPCFFASAFLLFSASLLLFFLCLFASLLFSACLLVCFSLLVCLSAFLCLFASLLFSACLLLCFSLLVCFSAFLCFFASLLFCFFFFSFACLLSCFSLLVCFPVFLFLCFSAFLLLCFSLFFASDPK